MCGLPRNLHVSRIEPRRIKEYIIIRGKSFSFKTCDIEEKAEFSQQNTGQ